MKMTLDRFLVIKRALDDADSVKSVAERFSVGWHTAKAVQDAPDFAHYRAPTPKDHPLVAKLKADKKALDTLYDQAIESLTKLYS